MTTANTVGVLAKRYGATTYQVDYVVKTRDIKPAMKAGNLRVFDEAGETRIAAELAKLKERRS